MDVLKILLLEALWDWDNISMSSNNLAQHALVENPHMRKFGDAFKNRMICQCLRNALLALYEFEYL